MLGGMSPSVHKEAMQEWRADRLKMLYWDRGGWALWSKRLETGTYAFAFEASGRKEITAGELAARLEGIDLESAKRRKRYLPPLQRNV
jgi:transposase